MACSLSTESLDVVLGQQTSALILSTFDARGTARIDAFDFGDLSRRYVSIPLGSGNLEVYVLEYGCSLDALGLSSGTLELAGESEAHRRLPEPARLSFTSISSAAKPELQAIDVAPDKVLGLRLPASGPRCAETRLALAASIPESRSPFDTLSAIVPLGGNRAMLTTTDGRIFAVSPSGLEQVADLPLGILGAYRAGTGEILLLGFEGRSMRGTLEPQSFSESQPTVSKFGFGRSFVSGPPNGDLSEVFLVDDARSFERFDGGAWQQLAIGPPTSPSEHRGVAWIAPGRAIASGLAVGPIARYDRGVLRSEPSPLAAGEHVRVLERIDGVGVVIGSSIENLYIETAEGWTARRAPSLGIKLLVPFAGGFLFGGVGGSITEYDLEEGSCESHFYGARDLLFGAEIEGGFVVGTEPNPDEDVIVYVVERTSPPPPPTRCPMGT